MAWGGHSCPARRRAAAQRPAIIALARQIRAAAAGPPWQQTALAQAQVIADNLKVLLPMVTDPAAIGLVKSAAANAGSLAAVLKAHQ